jgi:hypothetical protein
VRATFVVAAASMIGLAACRGGGTAPSPASSAENPVTASASVVPVASAAPSRLPEDPVAAKRSEDQWREHMAFEEHERQIGFDKRHLKEHRAVVAKIIAARGSYDRAKTEAALDKASKGVRALVDEVRRRVADIDHWGTNSHLLEDYAALETALERAYPEAKLSALKGDGATFDSVRMDFDAHLKAIRDWLEEAAESDEE